MLKWIWQINYLWTGLIYDVHIEVNESVVYLTKRYARPTGGALRRLHCKSAATGCFLCRILFTNYSQLVVLLNISLFCVYNKLIRKPLSDRITWSKKRKKWRKKNKKIRQPFDPQGAKRGSARAKQPVATGRGTGTPRSPLTMLNVWLRNHFIQALLPVGVVVQNKASYPVIVCACTMVLPLINNHQ